MTNDTDNMKSPTIQKEDQYQVILPCAVNQFGDFVSKLLGKPQIMEATFPGGFDISVQDISNVYYLITQRVAAQNEGALVNFSVQVFYSNGSAVTHKNVESFSKYHPTEPGYPIEVVLGFTYLVNFKGRPTPEKQQIEVYFAAEPNPSRMAEHNIYYEHGAVSYRIEHTERTWASDIASILRNHITNIVDKRGHVKNAIFGNLDEITNLIFLAVFVAAFGGWAMLSTSHASEYSINPSWLLGYLAKSSFVFVCLGAVLLFFREIFQNHFYIDRSSFIVLVEQDKEHRKKSQRKQLLAAAAYVFSWIMSIAAGIVSSILYSSFFAS